MPKQDTKATLTKETSVKHIKKIEAQQIKTGANGEIKREIRTAPGLGGACIPVGV